MPVIIASTAFLLIAYLVGNAKFAEYLGIPHILGVGDLTVLCLAIVGAGLAFLWFNAYPAMTIMGDAGSLTLGALLAVPFIAAVEVVLERLLAARDRLAPGHPLHAHRQRKRHRGKQPFGHVAEDDPDRRHEVGLRPDRPLESVESRGLLSRRDRAAMVDRAIG